MITNRTKRIAVVLAGAAVAMVCWAGGVGANESDKVIMYPKPVEVLYNAEKIQFDVKPKMMNDSVFVPIRFIADKLGGKLELTGRNLKIVRGKFTLELTIGSARAKVNGKELMLRVPVIEERGRTLVPLQVVNPGLGVAVEWDAASRYVWIGSKTIRSIDDVGIAVDIKPFLKYYEKAPYLLKTMKNGKEVNYTTVKVLSVSDLPVKLSDDLTIYGIHNATVKGEDHVGIRQTYVGEAHRGTHVALLTSDKKARFRPSVGAYTKNYKDQTKHCVYSMYGRDDKYIFGAEPSITRTINQVEYIQIDTIFQDSLILIKNPNMVQTQ
ncbi:copper amine oxidase N-terminal domain-containing protein [Paenibacillus oenotherae]|uniref:Copper amine oxidase N-terminal domain-containing protein n=1 Tax=Paenibacillus oenotherae TaxID=1435645 RepID=A0ABS7D3J4_9BACL|nr:stalk domain-containing protein [Paenibacillus oenotherae]MBW7474497.1 copper amine oxidase N-terminal domain-containing protein [Paenibacillus oenotherae]